MGGFATRAVGSIGPAFGGRTTKRCAHVIFARGKISCAVDPANAEAGPSKRMRVGKGKGKARETEPESEDEVAGPSVRTKILTDLLEEQRLHNQRLLAEIAQIRGALFQMGKLIKGIVLD